MEKLGVQKQDLLEGLRKEYQYLKEKEATLVKTGAPTDTRLLCQLETIKARIDELETQT